MNPSDLTKVPRVDQVPALERSIPEQKVPWDQSELKGRNCHACACYFETANPADPTKVQGFCRLEPANLIQLRGEVPRLDRNNHPVMKDGKPVMNNEVIPGYLYRVTQRDGTCFDGFRRKGTLPGEGQNSAVLREIVPLLFKVIKKTGTSIPPEVDQAVREILNIPHPMACGHTDPAQCDVTCSRPTNG